MDFSETVGLQPFRTASQHGIGSCEESVALDAVAFPKRRLGVTSHFSAAVAVSTGVSQVG